MFGEARQLIDGALVMAASGQTFPNINPATAEVIGETSDAGPEEIDAAIGAARRAFDETTWRDDPDFRARCLDQLHTALAERREELRDMVISEAGAPYVTTLDLQVDRAIDEFLPYWRSVLLDYAFEQSRGDLECYGGVHHRIVRREPAGVVGTITPWNFPMFLNLVKVGSALAAGCTVVLKPAPDTPWSGTILGRLIVEETDTPPGVVNVVVGADDATGAQLVRDPRIDMISFTGSTAVGKEILAASASSVRRCLLELGGKSATIICDDADFETAIPQEVLAMCEHAGQGCALSTRMLVPRSRYEEGVAVAKEAFDRVPVGDPRDPATIVGPLISERQVERVIGFIDRARDQGALVVRGGGRAEHLRPGCFVEPTLLADVHPDAEVARHEVFGPVLVVLPFEDDDDAVRIANDSQYGLGGGVVSASEERAIGIARRIRTGVVGVNGGVPTAADVPFGGYRQSGIGREMGVEGFEEYLETKVIATPAHS
jgi:aldehyde dehydrogenase (NAD+)